MSIIRIKGRALIGSAVIADAVDALRNPGPHEQAAAPLVAKLAAATGRSIEPKDAVRVTAITEAVGGGLIASSIAPRLGALATLAATVPAALIGYRFWEVKDDDARRAALRGAFFAHVALTGAALLILAGTRRKDRASGGKGRCHRGHKNTAAHVK
ncbi:MAG: DoxX family membrane protein [Bifidobacteriaceae bacterium]|jgi:uncharacterized membrane protein YphA (DoxX/SURF4 family)|nr:DoxX family membrane protein [Bifidobacteriaceae bacterium]